mgnify:CR=1 FL=1
MKKFLSLVLALVMTMSLVTVSAGAKDFTDNSKINYKEAVDVMSAVKVIDGYAEGDFRPANTLTRGAAAKIICNLILGPTTAEALVADAAPYSDVPTTNTFAGYIAYCQKEGIISGYADGTFKPANTLTGYAFMKMLLGALGYDSDIEGYVGANWSVAVAKQAVGIGLDDGNDEFVGVKAVTREEACLYAFNTLTADMVEYGQTTTLNVNGATVVVGGSKAGVVSNSESKDYRTDEDDQDEVMQFCEKYFTDLELRSDAATDSFGRPSNTWYNDNDKIGTYAKEADVVYTADVKSKDIYADLDLSDAYNYDVVVDGQESANDFVVAKRDNQDGYNGADPDDKIADVIGDVLGNGSLIEVYKDEQVITVVNTYIMQVNGDYDKDEEELTLATVDGAKEPDVSDDVLSSDDFDNLDAYEDEEYVLVTVADGVIKSIAKAEKVSGTVTEYVREDTVTAGGTVYKYSAMNDASDKSYELKSEYALYLDPYGYVLYTDGVEAEDNYVFISEFAKNSQLTTNSKVVAYAYFLDGKDDEITIDKVNNSKVTGTNVSGSNLTNVDGQSVNAGAWFKYTLKDGKYNLTATNKSKGNDNVGTNVTVVNYDSKGVMINYGSGTTKGNAATVFVILKSNGDVKVYTGIKNVPDIASHASINDTYVSVYEDSGYAKYVFVKQGSGTVTGGSNSSDVVFLTAPDKIGTDADDNSYYRYSAILNGEETKVKLDTNSNTLGGYLYTEIEYDEHGYITSWEKVDSTYANNNKKDFSYNAVNGTVTQKSSTITIDGVGYYLANNAKIFLIEGDDVTVVTAKKLATDYKTAALKANVTGVLNADGEYSALYICK